jgi:hypothetical protein
MTALTNDSAFSVGPFEDEQAAQLAETSADVDGGVGINDANYETDNVNTISMLLTSSLKDYTFENGR